MNTARWRYWRRLANTARRTAFHSSGKAQKQGSLGCVGWFKLILQRIRTRATYRRNEDGWIWKSQYAVI
jgi:hypothetical protein